VPKDIRNEVLNFSATRGSKHPLSLLSIVTKENEEKLSRAVSKNSLLRGLKTAHIRNRYPLIHSGDFDTARIQCLFFSVFAKNLAHFLLAACLVWLVDGYCNCKAIRTVTPKYFPLYHFFSLFSPLFFHLPQRFPLNTPLYPTTTIKYHFLYQLSIFIY
jgi:hypothetical protein